MQLKDLPEKAKRMLVSILLANIAAVVIDLFLNAFLWRELSSVKAIAIYNLGTIITLPIFFYINGFVLKRFKVAQMYAFGSCGRSMIIALVVFGNGLTNTNLLLYGLMFGAFNGFFWANRNYLSMKVTSNSNRIYFTALENIIRTSVGIAAPFVVGWFIVFVEKSGFKTSVAYEVVMVIGLIVALLAGFVMKSVEVDAPVFVRNLRFKKSPTWISFRIATMLEGVMDGVMIFVPVLIILELVGNEGDLGTVSAFSSILTAIVVYFIGKRAKARHRKRLIFLSLMMLVVVSGFFSIFFNQTSAIIFRLVQALAITLYWVIWSPLYYELIERQDTKDASRHYAYVVDTEIFLNIGRVSGIIITIMALEVFKEQTVLRYIPFVLALTQIPIMYFLSKVFKELKQFEVEYQEPIDEVVV